MAARREAAEVAKGLMPLANEREVFKRDPYKAPKTATQITKMHS
jgi:hypothetical protein